MPTYGPLVTSSLTLHSIQRRSARVRPAATIRDGRHATKRAPAPIRRLVYLSPLSRARPDARASPGDLSPLIYKRARSSNPLSSSPPSSFLSLLHACVKSFGEERRLRRGTLKDTVFSLSAASRAARPFNNWED